MNRRFHKFIRRPSGVIALIVLLLFVISAIGMEIYNFWCIKHNVIPCYDVSNFNFCYHPPCPTFWCGTDYQGRDVLLRAIAGSSTALKVGVISGIIATIIGTIMGILAGYYGRTIDKIVVFEYTTFASMPTLLFVLSFSLLLSPEFLPQKLLPIVNAIAVGLGTEASMLGVYVAIGLTGWISLCRSIRSECMKLRNFAFITAAKVSGVSDLKILFRHILPNVTHIIIIYFTTLFASSIMMEVIISFLGLGAKRLPSWGIMISNGQSRLFAGVWWEFATATIFLWILLLVLNILGDVLRDTLDPRQ